MVVVVLVVVLVQGRLGTSKVLNSHRPVSHRCDPLAVLRPVVGGEGRGDRRDASVAWGGGAFLAVLSLTQLNSAYRGSTDAQDTHYLYVRTHQHLSSSK